MNAPKKNKSIFKSLYHAACGFCDALKSERNMRVHFCVGNLICYFAVFYGINATQWAILLLTIGIVIASELFNSAVEMAVDTATHEIRTDAMHAKDFAAAATLVSAIASLGVGVALFGNIEKIINALTGMFTSPVAVIILIILIIIDLFVLQIKDKRRVYENSEL